MMKRLAVAVAGVATLVALGIPSAAAETLRLVANWPKSFYSTARTLEWANEFNESDSAKKAGVRIQFVGGPEVTPAAEQLTALRNGVFDMMFGAAGYYVGTVPEGFVFYGTSVTPTEARRLGGIELLSEIWSKKANAHVLGWVAAGIGYHVWLAKEPQLKADGTPDLSGFKIRSSPLYKSWLDSMGATNVMVPAPDIYGALERGLVDGAAWPGLGITDFGFEKFIKYRIDPPVWQFDNLLWINANKWKSLNPQQRNALAESVAKFESDAYAYYQKLATEEQAKTAKAGVKPFPLRPDAAKKYVTAAEALQWAEIKAKAPENYERLQKAFPPTR
jgi:TRAP-type C4-dicarboxylate transport system substrate-binding protein